MHGEHTDERRPTPIGPIARRVVEIDDEQFGDAPDDKEEGHYQCDGNERSPCDSTDAMSTGRLIGPDR